MMEKRRLSEQLDLYFPKGEEAAADLVAHATARSLAIIRQRWALPEPPHCRIYVMTGWLSFLLHSVPWYFLPGLALVLPFWAPRIRRLWPAVGGWMQRYARRPTVGIRAPRLLEKADHTIGAMIFAKESDLHRKTGLITCHELTHAFSAHLRLPVWLNEGIAMLAMDAYAGRLSVRAHTLQMLPTSGDGGRPRLYREILGMKAMAIASLYARAYWVTRYLDEKHPALLKGLLAKRISRRALEGRVAGALGVPRRNLWSTVDRTVAAHFTALIGTCECESCAQREAPSKPGPADIASRGPFDASWGGARRGGLSH